MATVTGEPSFNPTVTTADERDELFGVHIPELQLQVDDYRGGLDAARLAKGERYVELGCGHGRGLVVAAAEFDADVVGVEYLPEAIERANRAVAAAGVAGQVRIVRDDLRRLDLSTADVVHMHLGPAFHDVLAARLEQQLPSSARVVAAGWRVPGWLPDPDAERAWDAGYVYRPNDPAWQLSGHDAAPSLGVSVGMRTVVELTAHADLDELEVRIDGADARTVRAALSTTRAGRGQSLLLELERGTRVAPERTSSGDVEVELWSRARDGRVTRRGEPLRVTSM